MLWCTIHVMLQSVCRDVVTEEHACPGELGGQGRSIGGGRRVGVRAASL